ncbi:MAG: acyltransferase [Rhodothermia bacterium]|nr:acyltransferase [Rhodothermia bacterium]
MKVAVLQYRPEFLAVDANLDTVEEMLSEVDADLVVLPELFATGYFFRSTADAQSVSEPVPGGKTTDRMVEWAREGKYIVVGGLVEECSGRLFNSAAIVGPDGYVGRYRKLHLYYEEKLHFEQGNLGLPVFAVVDRSGQPYTLGVMICFDWYYPEASRTLALEGADIIAHPANLVRPDCPRAMPIRALENHLFTATANRIGAESVGNRTLTFIGQSEVCSPAGQVLVSMTRDEAGVAVVELDPAESRDRRVTDHNDLLADRRTDAYVL